MYRKVQSLNSVFKYTKYLNLCYNKNLQTEVNMVDKIKAKELREQGMTYDAISVELNCSLDWCKRNLKGVTKYVMEDDTVQELIKRAKSKDGITSGDISHEVGKIYPRVYTKEGIEEHEKKVRRVRTKIKAEEGTLIRPYWIQPEQSEAMYHSMLRLLQAKDERDQEDIDSFRAEFDLDETYVNSIKYALYSMSSIGSKILKHSVVQEINRIGEIVEVLEERNSKPKEKIAFTKAVPKTFKDSKEGVRIKNPIDLSDIDHLIY